MKSNKLSDPHDPHFIRAMLPYFKWLHKYFRYETRNLERIPPKGPVLVVMNHGIIPFHGFLLTMALAKKRKIYPRGLGASFLFHLPFIKDFFLKGGALEASHQNARKLLNEKKIVMLAPGGIYEALVAHPGMKRIPWERRMGFVRIALETKSPIIPTYCPGINDVYFNSKFLLKRRIKILEATRFSLPLFYGLGLIPLPVKLIHRIGKPIPVTIKKGETKSQAVKRLHQKVLKAMADLARP